MTKAYWNRLQELFYAASELTDEQRALYLDEQCADDDALRRHVESMLSPAGNVDDFLQGTVSAAAAGILNQEEGGQIGPYLIARRLGEGGMGTVYLATRSDEHFSKQVAIKLMKTGTASVDALRRFRAERQILANLDHPYIARLLDGGTTTTGLPYVVMEYVDGIPIDSYCREHRLSLEARLRLFLEVCSAVEYAHRNLIVHRDIKPANILVNQTRVPKLLDFGIAKLLTPTVGPDNPRTRATARLMTPEYASPEQVRNGPITTAVDVYSLGVLLYELLAGVRPYRLDGLGPAESERLICEQDPPKPSTAGELRRELQGDLDSIVLKALRKEPGRRYASVELLSEDVRRYLAGLPVQARPDTWMYVAGKFGRRHAVGLGTLATVILILIAGIISTTLARRQAVAAQERAQSRFRDILAMANSSLFEIHDSVADLSGSTRARALIVRRTLQYLNVLSNDSASDPSLLRELSSAYEKLADIQFRDGPGHLSDSVGALASARQALKLRQQIVSLKTEDRDSAMAAAFDMLRIADIQRLTRQSGNALPLYQSALDLYQQLGSQEPGSLLLREQMADAHLRFAEGLRTTGNAKSALSHIQEGLKLRQALASEAPSDPAKRRGVEQASMLLGDVYREQFGNSQAALEALNQALIIARSLISDFPRRNSYKTDLVSILSRIGNVYYVSNEPAKSVPYYREAWETIESLALADPNDGRTIRSVGIHNTNLAQALNKVGQAREAESRFQRSVAIHSKLAGEDPESTQHRGDLAYVHQALAELLLKAGRVPEASQHLKVALGLRQQLVDHDPKNVEYKLRLAKTYATDGEMRSKIGDIGQACKSFRTSQDLLVQIEGKMALGGEPKRLAGLVATCKP